MTSRVVQRNDDQDSFWSFLNGEKEESNVKDQSSTQLSNSIDQHIMEEEPPKTKNIEAKTPETGPNNENITRDDLAKILKRLDDLNKLDDIDESDNDIDPEPMYDEEQENNSFDLQDDKKSADTKSSDTKDSKFMERKEDKLHLQDYQKEISTWENILKTNPTFGKIVSSADLIVTIGNSVMSVAILYQAVKAFMKIRGLSN